jgi:hypothetical protein
MQVRAATPYALCLPRGHVVLNDLWLTVWKVFYDLWEGCFTDVMLHNLV